MDYKEEAIFYTLSGYAKEIVDINDKSMNGTAYRIANTVNKFFKKYNGHISRSDATKIVAILKQFDVEFNGRETSPSILLIITLYHLLANNHLTTVLKFGHYRSDVVRLFNEIEVSVYKQHLYDHLDLLIKFAND